MPFRIFGQGDNKNYFLNYETGVSPPCRVYKMGRLCLHLEVRTESYQ